MSLTGVKAGLSRFQVWLVLTTIVVCIGLAGCGAQPTDMTTRILVHSGDVERPDAVISEGAQVAEILKLVDSAKRLENSEEMAFTQDFYFVLTMQYASGADRTLRFNQGGGSVFEDDSAGAMFVLEREQRDRLHALVANAEK